MRVSPSPDPTPDITGSNRAAMQPQVLVLSPLPPQLFSPPPPPPAHPPLPPAPVTSCDCMQRIARISDVSETVDDCAAPRAAIGTAVASAIAATVGNPQVDQSSATSTLAGAYSTALIMASDEACQLSVGSTALMVSHECRRPWCRPARRHQRLLPRREGHKVRIDTAEGAGAERPATPMPVC